jgi:hypothetical protein
VRYCQNVLVLQHQLLKLRSKLLLHPSWLLRPLLHAWHARQCRRYTTCTTMPLLCLLCLQHLILLQDHGLVLGVDKRRTRHSRLLRPLLPGWHDGQCRRYTACTATRLLCLQLLKVPHDFGLVQQCRTRGYGVPWWREVPSKGPAAFGTFLLLLLLLLL